MKNFKFAVPFIMVLMLAFIFSGCAKPPEAEQAAAKAAQIAAQKAGAEKYAAVEWEAGKMLWSASEAQLKAEAYAEAKVGYLAAKGAFEKAVKTAAATKKTLAAEVTTTLTGLEEGWKVLEAKAMEMEKKMKDQKEAFNADAALFAQNLQAAKGAVAADLEGAKAKAGELKAMIDKWDTTLQELAKIPEKPVKKGPVKKGRK